MVIHYSLSQNNFEENSIILMRVDKEMDASYLQTHKNIMELVSIQKFSAFINRRVRVTFSWHL